MCQNLTQQGRATIVGPPKATTRFSAFALLVLLFCSYSCTTVDSRSAYYSALSTYVEASYAAASAGTTADARRLAAHEIASKAVAEFRAGNLSATAATLQLNLATATLFTTPGATASEGTTNDR